MEYRLKDFDVDRFMSSFEPNIPKEEREKKFNLVLKLPYIYSYSLGCCGNWNISDLEYFVNNFKNHFIDTDILYVKVEKRDSRKLVSSYYLPTSDTIGLIKLEESSFEEVEKVVQDRIENGYYQSYYFGGARKLLKQLSDKIKKIKDAERERQRLYKTTFKKEEMDEVMRVFHPTRYMPYEEKRKKFNLILQLPYSYSYSLSCCGDWNISELEYFVNNFKKHIIDTDIFYVKVEKRGNGRSSYYLVTMDSVGLLKLEKLSLIEVRKIISERIENNYYQSLCPYDRFKFLKQFAFKWGVQNSQDNSQLKDDNIPLSSLEKFLNLPLEVLCLGIRVPMLLKKENIYTVGELIEKSEDDIAKIPNFGKKCFPYLKKKLYEWGLSFEMTDYSNLDDLDDIIFPNSSEYWECIDYYA